MNLLQHISEPVWGPVLVTLNPPFPPHPSKTVGSWSYDHPMYTARSVRCQDRLKDIQNTRGITYVGAWTKYGFHEDGFSSSLRTLTRYLEKPPVPPFEIKNATRPLPRTTVLISPVLALMEAVRKVLGVPFGVVAGLVVLVLGVVVAVLRGLEGAGGGGFVAAVREEVETVRGWWVAEKKGEGEERVNGDGERKKID